MPQPLIEKVVDVDHIVDEGEEGRKLLSHTTHANSAVYVATSAHMMMRTVRDYFDADAGARARGEGCGSDNGNGRWKGKDSDGNDAAAQEVGNKAEETYRESDTFGGERFTPSPNVGSMTIASPSLSTTAAALSPVVPTSSPSPIHSQSKSRTKPSPPSSLSRRPKTSERRPRTASASPLLRRPKSSHASSVPSSFHVRTKSSTHRPLSSASHRPETPIIASVLNAHHRQHHHHFYHPQTDADTHLDSHSHGDSHAYTQYDEGGTGINANHHYNHEYTHYDSDAQEVGAHDDSVYDGEGNRMLQSRPHTADPFSGVDNNLATSTTRDRGGDSDDDESGGHHVRMINIENSNTSNTREDKRVHDNRTFRGEEKSYSENARVHVYNSIQNMLSQRPQTSRSAVYPYCIRRGAGEDAIMNADSHSSHHHHYMYQVRRCASMFICVRAQECI